MADFAGLKKVLGEWGLYFPVRRGHTSQGQGVRVGVGEWFLKRRTLHWGEGWREELGKKFLNYVPLNIGVPLLESRNLEVLSSSVLRMATQGLVWQSPQNNHLWAWTVYPFATVYPGKSVSMNTMTRKWQGSTELGNMVYLRHHSWSFHQSDFVQFWSTCLKP